MRVWAGGWLIASCAVWLSCESKSPTTTDHEPAAKRPARHGARDATARAARTTDATARAAHTADARPTLVKTGKLGRPSNGLGQQTPCKTNSDCVLSCISASDCCFAGPRCNIPYHRADLPRARAVNKRLCTRRSQGCPNYVFKRPNNRLVPVCARTRCTYKTVPR